MKIVARWQMAIEHREVVYSQLFLNNMEGQEFCDFIGNLLGKINFIYKFKRKSFNF